MEKDFIYLDHASTTYVYPEVIDEINRVMKDYWGNPSNLYDFGQKSKEIISQARESIANCIGAKPEEIFFTSGASEGNAWVCKQGSSILCSPYEHHNLIHNPKAVLIDENYLDMALANYNYELHAGNYESFVCSWMYVNNETGEIFPIERICRKAHSLGMKFHSDMTQALGNIHINVKDLGVDYATFSSHKCHMSKGQGFVYINSDTVKQIEPLIYGGGQESGIRAGTENVPYIAGARLAVLKAYSIIDYKQNVCGKLKKYMLKYFSDHNIKFSLNSPGNSVNNILNVSFYNITGDILTDILANEYNIYCSTGSACNSGNLEHSSVLEAMGLNEEQLDGAVRFSFDSNNTISQIRFVCEVIEKELKKYG